MRSASWLLALAALCAACDGKGPPDAATGEAKPPVHEHHAPHGGALVELGEEFAHIELLADPKTGHLTAWVLDGEAEQAVRVVQKSIELRVAGGPAPLTVTLDAVASPLSGETVGDTSKFETTAPGLVGRERFEGTVASISVRGSTFTDVPFQYPEGEKR